MVARLLRKYALLRQYASPCIAFLILFFVTAAYISAATPAVAAMPGQQPGGTVPTATDAPAPPRIFISEFMANPAAVNDSAGEWIELYNGGDVAVNLNGWRIADLGSDSHTIAGDTWIQPGQYIVLGRNGDFTTNGGVTIAYIYGSTSLANGDDEILLFAPGDIEADRIIWTNSVLSTTSGASLERTGFNVGDPWVTANTPWPGSAGDLGSPSQAYDPQPVPTETSTGIPTEIPTETPIPVESPVATDTPPPIAPSPRIFISEFLADPDAVGDSEGEWVEFFNGDSVAANLNGWRIADLGSNSHTIGGDIWIQPGQYIVIGRNADSGINGGVNLAYVYSSFDLANTADEILLIAPGDIEVDRVTWGDGGGLTTTVGASLERTTFNGDDVWVTAGASWPGSAGDWGSPGQPYTPPLSTPTPTTESTAASTPTPIPTSTAMPTDTATPTATEPPTSTPTPTLVATSGPPPSIFISEFLADPAAVADGDGEWIELYNADSVAVNLRGWYISDFGTDSHLIDVDVWIEPNAYAILARSSDTIVNGGIPVLYVYNGISLANGNDELRLLAPGGVAVDQVFWGGGTGLSTTAGASLERSGFAGNDSWMTAHTPWPGSAGDLGSPNQAYVPSPGQPTPTPTPPPNPTSLPGTPTVPPISGPPSKIFISEFLANPGAVNDGDGEWIEFFNADVSAVNLRGWRIADMGTDGHTIAVDLIVPSNGYVVIGRNVDPATNGGVDVAYVYSSTSLANGDDEILLIAPGDVEADRVTWGVGGLATTAGASLERTGFTGNDSWTTAHTPWPGSAGDLGSPNQAYVPSPGQPTPTPTPPPNPTSLPGTPTVPPISGPPPKIFISEFLANPGAVNDGDGEWIEFFNADGTAVNLRGWRIADLGTDGHTISADLIVPSNGYVVIARNADFATNGGVDVAYVYSSISLANGNDEILLIAPGDIEADRVTWGVGGLTTTAGASLEHTGFTGNDSWTTAHTPWPGSAGDLGSPNQAYIPSPGQPTPTPTSPPNPTSPPGTPTVPPISGPPPKIFISEFLANPGAVNDGDGEWIEFFNADGTAVNLRGWRIADLGTDGHTISADLIVPSNGYVVIARNADFATNGGVDVAYVYSSISLANGDDEILLIAPGDVEADRVTWGVGGLATTAGASLERTGFTGNDSWTTAHTPWPGSAGDLGSPNQAYIPSPGQPTPTPPPDPTNPPGTPTVPPISGPPPKIFISEFLANPDAVGDSDGEWIEFYNGDEIAVNLRGWKIADLDSDAHIIEADLYILPTQYLVIGRNGDASANGGVHMGYLYDGVSLANSADELLLIAPGDVEMDRVRWGDNAGPSTTAGASLERTGFSGDGLWVTAQTVWPGSAGDRGTPGSSFDGSVTPEPTGPAPTPTMTTTVTPTPPASGEPWPETTTTSPLRIEEVAFKGSDQEFVALLNVSDSPVDLADWSVGDAERSGDGEGMYALPAVTLAANEFYLIARDGAAFRAAFGRSADGQFEETDDPAQVLERRTALARGKWALNDSGDEVALLNPAGELADAVAYGNGNYAALGLSGLLRPPSGFSLHHVPGLNATSDGINDQRYRWLFAPPDPFAVQALPTPSQQGNPALDEGTFAIWGSLGAHSNFTQGYTAPPAYLLAASGAAGLDFLAVADDGQVTLASGDTPLAIPAWQWRSSDDEQAVVYSARTTAIDDPARFVAWLDDESAYVQWQSGAPPDTWRIVAIAGDETGAPGELKPLIDAWSANSNPLLPAGNANPTLPGRAPTSPRYTGLAVNQLDSFGVTTALIARRGWLTNKPGLWLTLRAETDAGLTRWMGSEIPAANEINIDIRYGDLDGDVAGLALWQNDRPIRQLDIPPQDGHWRVTVPALPGARLFVVATQMDGDFAVTAPLVITEEQEVRVRISEVMAAPQRDYNGDGLVDNDDEYIELHNPGAQPTSLAGWQITDKRGDATPGWRFTFGNGRYIGGGQRLVLWRSETWVNLDNSEDYVRLLNASGEEVDALYWTAAPAGSISQNNESGDWQVDTVPSPGGVNLGLHGTGTPKIITVDPTEGQAGGAPGSLAMAKRRGLEKWVEFRGVVTVPPGLFNASMYVADPASDGLTSGIGIQVYLRNGELPPLQEGDWVLVRGMTKSFRGEMEIVIEDASQVWRLEGGALLTPLPVTIADIGESLEGRLVRFSGVISGWQGDSIYLSDPDQPDVEPVRVTVRSSLDWRRPYVQKGEWFAVVGVVGQFSRGKPWNGGYRVLVRYEGDLIRVVE